MNFKVHEDMTCEVKNVIYVKKCRDCGKEYIGETGNFLHNRVIIHNKKVETPVTECCKLVGTKTNVPAT